MRGIGKRVCSILALAGLTATFIAACSDSGGDDQSPSGVSSITLTVSSADAMASLGDTRSIAAVAKDASGATLSNATLTYTSSAPTVATVTGNGLSATVTAVGNGTATITATSGTVQGTTTVTVTQRATTVAVTGIPASMAPGATAQLSAEARDARGRAVSGATGFTYISGNEAVAVVSSTGLLTAISPGNTQISSTVTVAGNTVNGSGSVPVAFAVASNPTSGTVQATDQSQFNPSSVTIATGGNVTWSFGQVIHNVTFGSGGGAPATIGNSSSTQVSRTFATAGRFDYNCTLHPGMNGTVIVQANPTAPSFTAILNGANERPNPVTTNGAGAASFVVNGTTVSYVVTFARLSGAPIMAHIHGPGNSTQAVGVLVDFPTAGQTQNNGVLTGTFNAASIRNANISLDSLLVLMRNGNAYVNVHTNANQPGEIRGQVGTP